MEIRINDISNLVIASSFFDPRFKSLNFLNDEKKTEIMNLLNQDYTSMTKVSSNLNSPEKTIKILSKLTGKSLKTKATFETEWSSYINLPEEDMICNESDPLNWWKLKESQYPNVAKLAKKYLCIQGSSAESEGLFSTLKDILSDKRMSTRPEIVCLLLFLFGNQQFLSKQ